LHKYPTVRLNSLTLVYNLKGIIFRINIIKVSILLFKVSLNTIYSYTQQAQTPKQILFYLFRDFYISIFYLSYLSYLSAPDRYRPLPTATPNKNMKSKLRLPHHHKNHPIAYYGILKPSKSLRRQSLYNLPCTL
jgi:hypothetical protein